MQGLFIRRQHDVAAVYARIVADEILTVAEFGSELLTGPQLGPHPALIERSMRPAIDRAIGPRAHRDQVRARARRSTSRSARRSRPSRSTQMMEPLTDPEFSRSQSAAMRKLITDRIRAMAPNDFAELLRTATKEDEWLLLAARRRARSRRRADPPGDLRMSVRALRKLVETAPSRRAAGGSRLSWRATRWSVAVTSAPAGCWRARPPTRCCRRPGGRRAGHRAARLRARPARYH